MKPFLNEERIYYGPWQAFERDFARLLIANNFDDVRIIGGSGDAGGDVLGVRQNDLWVFQCKHSKSGRASAKAVDELVNAQRAYGADYLGVVLSLPVSKSIKSAINRYKNLGLKIEAFEPSRLLKLMEKAPEYPITRKTLRDYQEEAAEDFSQSLVETGRALMVMATGLGKTVVMAEVVADLIRSEILPTSRVLVLAHTRELVSQLHTSFWYQLPKWVHTHQFVGGEFPSYWDGITFATVQSVVSKLDELPIFDLILIDEAHHVGASTFKQVIDHLNPRYLGGVTATPWRGDRYDINEALGPAVVQIGIADGLSRGFLADVDYRMLADNVDWEFVKDASKHSYSLAQLNRRLLLPKRDGEAARMIVDTYREENRRGGIVFSPSIEHAYSFAGWLRNMGASAEAISSDSTPREQEVTMARFRSGDYAFVVTVDMFNEGVDVPDVDMIVFMRATHSRRIFVQQLGRGLRATPSKDKVVVLDFVSDLRRMAEVLQLDSDVRSNQIERLGLGNRIVQFSDQSAGNFLKEWMLDQADLLLREDSPFLELPHFEFPYTIPPGSVQ